MAKNDYCRPGGRSGVQEKQTNKQTNKQKTKELPCSLMYANKK
jgi:hypothetical protein